MVRSTVRLDRDEFHAWLVLLLSQKDNKPCDRWIVRRIVLLRPYVYGNVSSSDVRRLLHHEKRKKNGFVRGPVGFPSEVCYLRREVVTKFHLKAARGLADDLSAANAPEENESWGERFFADLGLG